VEVLAKRFWQFAPLLLCKGARSVITLVVSHGHCYRQHVYLLLLPPRAALLPWVSRQACCALLLLLLLLRRRTLH
jgi:hypothetical protein